MSNFIGGYPQITEVGGDDLLPVIQGGELKNAKVNDVRGYMTTTVDVSSAQILLMGDNPVELLPAPGAGKYYDINKIYVEFTYGTTQYTLADSEIFIGTTDGNYLGSYITRTIMTKNHNIYVVLSGYSPVEVIGSRAVFSEDELNLSINLTSADGANPADGNGTFKIKMEYKIVTFG
jgi:hypothetical protein